MNSYYQKHKINICNYMKDWYNRNRNRIRVDRSNKRKIKKENLKKNIFDKLENKCNNPNCPIPKELMNIKALQIDHKNNNGSEERRKYGKNSPEYLKHILENLDEYQLLCVYCNWLKSYDKMTIRERKGGTV